MIVAESKKRFSVVFCFVFYLFFFSRILREKCVPHVRIDCVKERALAQAVSRFVAVSGYAMSGLCVQILFIYTVSPLSREIVVQSVYLSCDGFDDTSMTRLTV